MPLSVEDRKALLTIRGYRLQIDDQPERLSVAAQKPGVPEMFAVVISIPTPAAMLTAGPNSFTLRSLQRTVSQDIRMQLALAKLWESTGEQA